MKRLGIFLIYDREGIADEYIYFLLEKMKTAYDELVIVCNCSLQAGYKERLQLFSNEIHERENKGFDAGAFKDALNDYIGWDRVGTFEELLLFNDSFYGPFFPITEVFDSMDDKKLDFWSMTKNNGNYKKSSAIQSYFFVIKNRLLHSSCFEEYWKKLPYYESFEDVVHEYEMKFAEYFTERGFVWDSYIDSDRYSRPRNSKNRVSLYHTVPNEIIEEQRYPFLKRKLFDLNALDKDYGLDRQTHENFVMALKYIQDNTDYNMDYIWENVLRTYSLRNIQDCCCSINVIEPSGVKNDEHNVKAVAWLLGQRSTYKNIHRIFSQLDLEDIIIGTDSHELAGYLKEQYGYCSTLECQSPAMFWKKILTNAEELEQGYGFLICFTDISCEHEADEYYVSKASAVWNRWENIFGDLGYIDKVQSYFEKNKHVGMLVAPMLIHGRYLNEDYITESDTAMGNLFGVCNLIERSRFFADWSESFWIRLGAVNGFDCEKVIRALESGIQVDYIAKLLPYVCQKNKYLTEVVESTIYAAFYEKAQMSYIRNVIDVCENGISADVRGIDYFTDMKKIYILKEMNEDNIRAFVKAHKQIYIYGCGEIAKLLFMSRLVNGLCGFIVSDGERKSKLFFGYPISELSEIEPEKELGVIVALNEKNSMQVEKGISEKFKQGHILLLKSEGKL